VAVKLAAKLQAQTGIPLTPLLVFQHPTPRAVAAHLADLGAPPDVTTPDALLALIEELVVSNPHMASLPAQLSSPLSGDASMGGPAVGLLSPLLARLSSPCPSPGCATALFALPNGTGSAPAYVALASVLVNVSIYSAAHPHLNGGALHQEPGSDGYSSPSGTRSRSRGGTSASTVTSAAASFFSSFAGALSPVASSSSLQDDEQDGLLHFLSTWTDCILAECEQVAIEKYFLIGASLGGLFAHLVGLSANRRGFAPRGIVLIDPSPPPLSPLPHVRLPGVRGAAAYLAMHAFESDTAFLDDVNDDDLGVALAARRAEVGLTPFSPASVLERQRELRVTAQLLDLAAQFQAAPTERMARRSAVDVWLALATDRERFFIENAGLTHEEASANTARQYGDLAEEIVVEGNHLEVCQQCMVGQHAAFNAMLVRACASGADADEVRFSAAV